MTPTDVHLRPASAADESFILSLVPRLVEFGAPPWRDAEQMIATDRQVLRDKLEGQPPGSAIFIAEDADGTALGLIHLQPGADYYNREPHGHIADLIVAHGGEGRGVGRLLMAKGEEWARTQGFRWLTLSVFATNTRARELYERNGFGEDMVKYVKTLQ